MHVLDNDLEFFFFSSHILEAAQIIICVFRQFWNILFSQTTFIIVISNEEHWRFDFWGDSNLPAFCVFGICIQYLGFIFVLGIFLFFSTVSHLFKLLKDVFIHLVNRL